MKKICVILGTRPEIIKLYPVIKALKNFEVKVIFTGQHKDMGKQMLDEFKIKPDYDLDVMFENQSLSELTATLHSHLGIILRKEKPDLVIVQGDTASAMVGAIEGYFHKIPVAHVEAGLRTSDIYNPFPEEINRRIISQIATYNFASTDKALEVLNREAPASYNVKTGQTGIDTLLETSKKINVGFNWQVLVTLHRRESFGMTMDSMLEALKVFLNLNPRFRIVFPVHPNPNVQERVKKTLGKHPRVRLTEPLGYKEMITEMKKSYFIMTDSGGIQEEAPSLKKPVLVLRETTERPEGVSAGVSMLVGTSAYDIVTAANELANNKTLYQSMRGTNPYGDGKASKKIADYLEEALS